MMSSTHTDLLPDPLCTGHTHCVYVYIEKLERSVLAIEWAARSMKCCQASSAWWGQWRAPALGMLSYHVWALGDFLESSPHHHSWSLQSLVVAHLRQQIKFCKPVAIAWQKTKSFILPRAAEMAMLVFTHTYISLQTVTKVLQRIYRKFETPKLLRSFLIFFFLLYQWNTHVECCSIKKKTGLRGHLEILHGTISDSSRMHHQ